MSIGIGLGVWVSVCLCCVWGPAACAGVRVSARQNIYFGREHAKLYWKRVSNIGSQQISSTSTEPKDAHIHKQKEDLQLPIHMSSLTCG